MNMEKLKDTSFVDDGLSAPPPSAAVPATAGSLDFNQLISALDDMAKAGQRFEETRPLSGPSAPPAIVAAARAGVEAARAVVDQLIFPAKHGEMEQRVLDAAQAEHAAARERLAMAEALAKDLASGVASDPECEVADLALSRAKRALDRASLPLQDLHARNEAARAAAFEVAFARFYPGFQALQNEFLATMRTALALSEKLERLSGYADGVFPQIGHLVPWPADYVLSKNTFDGYAEMAEMAATSWEILKARKNP